MRFPEVSHRACNPASMAAALVLVVPVSALLLAAAPAGAQTDATLKSLVIANDNGVEWVLTPAFDPATTSYAATVGSAETGVTVTAQTTDPGASVAIDPADSDAAAGFQVSLNTLSPTTITITVTAAGDGIAPKQYTVAVTRDASAPVLTGDATVSYPENGGVRVATYTGTDPAELRLFWTLTGTDASLFSIDDPDGALRFKTPPDFEDPADDGEDSVYNLNVVVTDGSLTATQSVAVTVTDQDEPGTAALSAIRPRMGTELTGSVADPDVDDPVVTWQWERSSGRSAPGRWTVIAGATSAGYTPVAADAGEFLRVTATYGDGGEDKTVQAETANVVGARLLSGLQATTRAATAESSRALRPAFSADVLHYAIGCDDDDTLNLTLSAGQDARLAVDGVQAESGNAVAVAVTGQSDVSIAVTGSDGASTTYTVHCLASDFFDIEARRFAGVGVAEVMQDLILMSRGRYVALLDNNGVPRFRRRIERAGAFLRLAYVGDEEEYRYSYIDRLRDTSNDDLVTRVVVLDEHFYADRHRGHRVAAGTHRRSRPVDPAERRLPGHVVRAGHARSEPPDFQ